MPMRGGGETISPRENRGPRATSDKAQATQDTSRFAPRGGPLTRFPDVNDQ